MARPVDNTENSFRNSSNSFLIIISPPIIFAKFYNTILASIIIMYGTNLHPMTIIFRILLILVSSNVSFDVKILRNITFYVYIDLQTI